MSHVPEMQRWVEHLEAPGWEIGGMQGFGPTPIESIQYYYDAPREEILRSVADPDNEKAMSAVRSCPIRSLVLDLELRRQQEEIIRREARW